MYQIFSKVKIPSAAAAAQRKQSIRAALFHTQPRRRKKTYLYFRTVLRVECKRRKKKSRALATRSLYTHSSWRLREPRKIKGRDNRGQEEGKKKSSECARRAREMEKTSWESLARSLAGAIHARNP